MGYGSGIGGQWGMLTEATINTPIAVTRFLEIISEGVERVPNKVQSMGLHAGGLGARASRYTEVNHSVSGPVVMELPTKGLGKILQHMFGSFSTTATQIASTAAYQQIHNLASTDGHTFTCQKGVPDTTTTVNPWTASGCKIADWEVTVSASGLAMLNLTIDAMDMVATTSGATALQTASYTVSTGLFSALDFEATSASAMTVASGIWTPTTPTTLGNVRSFSLKGGQPKNTSRFNMGKAIKDEALQNNFQSPTWTAEVEYSSATLSSALVANTNFVLQFGFVGATAIAGSNYPTLLFTLPAAFVDKGTPALTGPDIITVSYSGLCQDDGTNGLIQAYVISTDTSV